MDTAAMETAKLLGTGTIQLVLAIGVVFFATMTVALGMLLFKELKACSTQLIAITTTKIESDNKLAVAIEVNTQVMRSVLDARRA